MMRETNDHRRPVAIARPPVVRVAAALLLAGAFLAAIPFLPPRSSPQPRLVTIERGLTLAQIAQRLRDAGVIRSEGALRVGGRLHGYDRDLRAGVYEFPGNESVAAVLERLRTGVPASVRITIPEGLTIRGTAEVAAAALGFPADSYAAAARDSRLAPLLGVEGPDLEGFLYPETYAVAPNAGPRELIELQVQTFWSVFAAPRRERAAALGMSPREVVILASIIEREAALAEERARIAAVFHNRLELGMMLQADPTVRYAVDAWQRPLTKRDLAVDSPYNTYRVAGLPPGPICSPGRASLEAALFPLPGSDELYFVARGDGSHIFSKTNREHVRAREHVRNGERGRL
jgi:UPF0755 protein